MTVLRRQFLRATGFATLALLSRSAYPQNWPAHTVRLVVGVPPGGDMDSAARILADRLSEIWGQSVIVDNKPGANGRIAFEAVAHAAPDGCTMLMTAGAPEVNRFLFSRLTFDPTADFAPVSLVGRFPDIIVVSTASPFFNLKDFIASAKARPGHLSWASPGVGTAPHLAGELFKLMAGIRMTHVPYEGITEGFISDLISGRIDAVFDTAGSLLQAVRSHQVRAIAVTSGERFPNGPDIPTVSEAAVPGYDVSSWYGLYVPSKTPPEIVEQMNSDVVVMLREQTMKEKFASLGVLVAGSRPQELVAKNSADAGLWKSVIEAANIKAE